MNAEPLAKTHMTIDGLDMAYHESGQGESVVFLHGNPTSSYLWRNVIPHVSGRRRCIAPDLIGMGDSAKIPNAGADSYRFVEHRHYLDGLLEALVLGDSVTLVVHDWGSALGFDWAMRNHRRVAGIVYMEAIVRPMEWSDWPESATEIFRGFRSPAGEEMILERNLFVDAVLPASVLRDLTPEELEEYRRPFREPADRWPTLTWPREIPLGGRPADVVEIVREYSEWMATAPFKKLFVNAEPGAILTGSQREFCRTWSNQSEVTVPGIHFIQEDSADEIGHAIHDWLL